MGYFQSFADARKCHGVVPHDVATAKYRKSDGAARAYTGFAVSIVDRYVFQLDASSLCNCASGAERGP